MKCIAVEYNLRPGLFKEFPTDTMIHLCFTPASYL